MLQQQAAVVALQLRQGACEGVKAIRLPYSCPAGCLVDGHQLKGSWALGVDLTTFKWESSCLGPNILAYLRESNNNNNN